MSRLSYLGHIDSLRALAVILVLLFHLDINFFHGGFIGVDVFFSLIRFYPSFQQIKISLSIVNQYNFFYFHSGFLNLCAAPY
jgi:hypothetical protein